VSELLTPFSFLLFGFSSKSFSFEKLIDYWKSIDFTDRARQLTEQFPRGYGFHPNPRPKKSQRTISRPPNFEAGDCLSVRLSNGQFAAAIVLVADRTDLE
jgi:hypothetical protein